LRGEKREFVVPTRLTKEEFSLLRWYCQRFGFRRSEVLRRAWVEFVKNHSLREKKEAEERGKACTPGMCGGEELEEV